MISAGTHCRTVLYRIRVLLQLVVSEVCLRVRKAEHAVVQFSVNTRGLDKMLKVISLNNSPCTIKKLCRATKVVITGISITMFVELTHTFSTHEIRVRGGNTKYKIKGIKK
jgi:6-phosphogluconate dehydrogenase (decarboxylating)